MRVLVVAFGSRGDVAPYTGLGARLQQAGHTVTVAAHDSFAPLVCAAGLGFHDLPGDLGALLALPPDASPRFLARRVGVFTNLLHRAGQATIEAAAAGTDLILMNGSAPFAYHVAEAMRLPSMGVLCQPVTPTADFPPIVLHSARSWGRRGNRALGHLMMRSASPFHRVAAELRAQLGLPRLSYTATTAQDAARCPVLHGYSPTVLPRPADRRLGLDVVGYWWPATEPGWEPRPRLAEFLAAGPPPVFVGFGSMAAGHGDRLTSLAVAALHRAGVRGVLQSGWAGLDDNSDAADVLTVGEVPHEQLFPRMAAVVHHAGAGTTAAALRAGVPSVPIPIYADQPLWATRLAAIGAAPAPIPFRRLTVDRLAAAIRDDLGDPRHRTAARSIADQITRENGAEVVVRAVARLSGA